MKRGYTKRKNVARIFSVGLAAAVMCFLIPRGWAAQPLSGRIEVDGSTRDWDTAGIEPITLPSVTDNVSTWRGAKGPDGTVYLCFEGSSWKGVSLEWSTLSIRQNGTESQVPFHSLFETSGVEQSLVSDSNGWQNGPFVQEIALPADYFTDPDFTITFGGSSLPAGAIPLLDGVASEEEPTYSGIRIDGKFYDWDAVVKYETKDPSGRTDEAAMVFDGDVYLYLREREGSAAGAGPNYNGRYLITTDMGYEIEFQLSQEGTVSGIEGAEAIHMGRRWEIRIPKDRLPGYKKALSFGFYGGDSEPFVSNVADLTGAGGNVGEFTGIVIDGQYGDWQAYPHTKVGYNSDEKGTNSYMALYKKDSTLYIHVSTTESKNLNGKGNVFLNGWSVTCEGVNDGSFPLRLKVLEDGAYVDAKTPLKEGTHTLGIFSSRFWDDTEPYGTMMVTITGTQDQMECDLDLEKMVERLGLDPNEVKDITVSNGGLGSQKVSLGGTSSAPWLLLGLTAPVAALAGHRYYKRKEEKEK